MKTLYCSAGLFLDKSYYTFTFWFGEEFTQWQNEGQVKQKQLTFTAS